MENLYIHVYDRCLIQDEIEFRNHKKDIKNEYTDKIISTKHKCYSHI